MPFLSPTHNTQGPTRSTSKPFCNETWQKSGDPLNPWGVGEPPPWAPWNLVMKFWTAGRGRGHPLCKAGSPSDNCIVPKGFIVWMCHMYHLV